jgi:thiamine biosynthesis lipoprotein
MSSPDRRTWVDQVMGLPVSVLARGADLGSSAEAAVRAVYTELRQVDGTFSTYRDDSEISRLGRRELALTDCSPEVQDVARRCAEARDGTGGRFDATTPTGAWDPSGLVKGWAAERAFRHLAAVPGLDWCLNAGGDVLVGSPSGQPFTVGIQDPHDRTRVLAALPLVAGAVATSGTSARGRHLYDPRTSSFVEGTWLSVSVTGPSLETADVLATAAFVAGTEWTSLLPDGYAGLAVAPDRTLLATPGWPRQPA